MLKYGVIVGCLLVSPGYGQSVADQASFRNMTLGGIHLYGVSVFSGYSTSAYPGSLGQIPAGANTLGPDVNYGATASLGWKQHRQRWDFSLLYSGTYGGMVRYSDANAFSQYLSFSGSRIIRPKLTFSISGSGSDTTMAQFLYQPSNVGLITQVPASFDDFAAAFAAGQFTSNQAASLLTGAPLLESPARSLLLGDRILSYSAQTSLQYAYSSRLSFHVASFAAGGQHRLGGNNTVGQSSVLPRSIGANAGVGMSYKLSPRTELGVDVSGNRLVNRYQSAYTTTANVSVGRKMGLHWFLRAYGGGSSSQVTSQAFGTPRTKEVTGGGSIGFRTYQNTLAGSYDRAATDVYGFALGTTTSLSAAWNWQRPGSRWSVFTSFGQQQIRNTGYASLSGWQATGGMAQSLNAHARMTVQYVYMSNNGTYLGNLTNFAVHSVRMSMSWTPQVEVH